MSLTAPELRLVQSEFKMCDRWHEETDVIFVYPSAQFAKDAAATTRNLQQAYLFLLQATPISVPPNPLFGHRLVIGYRHHSEDEDPKKQPHELLAGYAHWQNRINIPWRLLSEPEPSDPFPVRTSDQPEFACSHELVHPFECVFLRNNPNKKWKEGFCDALRAGVLVAMGYPKYAAKWKRRMCSETKKRTGSEYHDAAGRILGYLDERHVIGVRSAIAELISGSMDNRLDPKGDIRFGK